MNVKFQFITLLMFVTLLKTSVRDENIKIPFLSLLCLGLIRILITFSKAGFIFKPDGTLKTVFIDNTHNLKQTFLCQEYLFFSMEEQAACFLLGLFNP